VACRNDSSEPYVFHKMQRISQAAEEILASKEELCSMEVV
jgi:hypothetical protein